MNDRDIIHSTPQLVSLGLNHSLCISGGGSSTHKNKKNTEGSGKLVGSYLSVLSWGKVAFNCLGQGVDVSISELPRTVPFFDGKQITQVSCGDFHSAVLTVSGVADDVVGGTLFTFGLGNSGRLGYRIDSTADSGASAIDDADEDSWCTPVPHPVGLSVGLKNNVVNVSCGANHTLVTTVDGYLYSWGVGAFGVLGTGNTSNQHVPVKVAFPNEDVFISGCSAGSRHSLALDKNGNIWSWGYGANGRLGLGNTKSYYSPVMINIFDNYEIIQISCGDSHTSCIDRFGSVYTWGSAKNGKLGHGKHINDLLVPKIVEVLLGIHIIQISCGTGNTLALSSSGKVYHWGYIIGINQFTSGLSSNIIYTPQLIEEIGSKNVYIAAGPYSCAVVNVFGDLLTWGIGSSYRLGHNDTSDYAEPKIVSELRNKIYVDTLLKPYGKTTIDKIPEDNTNNNPYDERRILQISVGDAHGTFITHNGNVYTWGVNNGLGYNVSKEPLENYAEPCLLNHFSSKVKRITCGSNHTLAVTVNGLLFSWGCNDNGQLGFGDLRSRNIPEHVAGVENVINVFAGIDNSCCITSSNHEDFISDDYGTLWVFGSSCGGKLGFGEGTSSTIMTPRRITNINGVHKVALGSTHTIAITQDGSLYSCGVGTHGRLGTGDTNSASTFVQVQSDVKFIDVAVGSSHSLAISAEHDLYGWGHGKYLCFNDENVLTPTLISSLPSPCGTAKVCAVVAAGTHSLVLADAGYIVAWGDNKFGQLGVKVSNVSNDFINTPVVVELDTMVVSITTSRYYTACSNSKGDTFSWGLSSDNRLGVGFTKDKIVYKPTPISITALVADMMDIASFDSNDGMDTYSTMIETFLNEMYFFNDKGVNWSNLQILLKNEERTTWESSLKTFEDDLIKCLMKHVDFIFNMSESHNQMKMLQFRLMAIIRSFISKIGNIKEAKVKSKDPILKFKSKAIHIEKIIEIIFLQPAYFVRLSLFCNDIDTVADMISAVYNGLENNRVHNQFISCLLSILREEIKLLFNPITPLNASHSPFSRILRAYMRKKHITSLNAHHLFSKSSESIVSYMELYKERILIPQDETNNIDDKTLNSGITNFGKFIIHFGTILTKFVIPDRVKLLFSTMYRMIKVKIPLEWTARNVPFDDVAAYPLIPIFVYAVIQPFFQTPNIIAEQCGFPIIEDATILTNFNVISQYLEYITNPELKMPKMSVEIRNITEKLYRNLSKLFLNNVKSILNYDGDFNIDMTMEIFKSHFDIDCINVVLPSHLVAKFINLCYKNENYLNMSAHDPLNKIISTMVGSNRPESIFGEDILERLEAKHHSIKIKIEHRFMIFDKNMSFCTFSNTFLPQRLAYRQHTHTEDCIKYISLILRYVPYGKYDPAKTVQDVLVSIKELNIHTGDYNALCEELEEQSLYYTNLNEPNFALATMAKNAINTLKKLDSNKVPVYDLVKVILEKVQDRIRHRNYLMYIYKRQNEIEDFKKRYENAISYNCEYLKKCITHASSSYIEPSITQALHDTLSSSKSKHNIILSKGSRSYACSDLIKMNVLFPNNVYDKDFGNQMKIEFTADINGGYYIQLLNSSKSCDFKADRVELSVDTLQTYVDSPNSGFYELFTSEKYPRGMFTIKTAFLSDTFMQLISN